MNLIRSQNDEMFELPIISNQSCEKLPYILKETFGRERLILDFMVKNFKIE
jgi:hypothetical protein